MKKLFLTTLFLAALVTVKAQAVRLPRIISSGMVLQRNDSISLWGEANPGEKVLIVFNKKKAEAVADAQGKWSVRMAPQKAGGPYVLTIGDQKLTDVYVGDVWLTSGQSNMDVHVDRVREVYADEFAADHNDKIHLIQLDRTCVPDGPHSDIGPGSYKWESLDPSRTGHWSALSYFFAKEMFEETGVPQGIINASLGGSNIVAFISRGKLEEVAPEYVRDMDRLRTPGYLERNARLSNAIGKAFAEVQKEDPGLEGKWMSADFDDSQWQLVNPFTHRNRWRGTLWFRKEIIVPDSLAGRDAILRLGYWIDSDDTYINGTKVGSTGYEYPPRLYKVPANVLKTGRNVLTVHLKTGGNPTIAMTDKPYRLVFPRRPESAYFDINDPAIPIEGDYRMHEGMMLPSQPGVEGVNNSKGSVLYDGQIAPIANYRIAGIIWNQGETNAGRPDEYAKLLPALAGDWRSHFGEVPFIIVQLANYTNRHTDANYQGGWAKIREVQRVSAETIPNAGMACAIEIGEWNDIHPLRKKDIAHRCALQAKRLYLGKKNLVATGPAYESVSFEGGKAIVHFRAGTDQLQALRVVVPVAWRQCDYNYENGDPQHLEGFAIAGADGRFVWADARIEGNTVVCSSPSVPEPKFVRYAWDDNPAVSLFGANGLPAAPFSSK